MALNVAVIGSGNIGSDLMFKIFRNKNLKMIALVGIDPNSDGLGARAQARRRRDRHRDRRACSRVRT